MPSTVLTQLLTSMLHRSVCPSVCTEWRSGSPRWWAISGYGGPRARNPSPFAIDQYAFYPFVLLSLKKVRGKAQMYCPCTADDRAGKSSVFVGQEAGLVYHPKVDITLVKVPSAGLSRWKTWDPCEPLSSSRKPQHARSAARPACTPSSRKARAKRLAELRTSEPRSQRPRTERQS